MATPKKGISKIEAVRQALAHFGNDTMPSKMQPWIKQQFGIDISANHISASRCHIRKMAGKAKAPTPAPRAADASVRTPKPAASAAKESAVAKPAPQQAAAASPQVRQAAAQSNAPPKRNGAGHGISLEDLQTVK